MFDIGFLIIASLFLLGSFDDLFIDWVHFMIRFKPKVILPSEWKAWRSLPEKRLAIMIPAWQESSVLNAMVKTNLNRIRYRNYRWFIGVYPNDPETMDIALRLQEKHPGQVDVIITDRPGPTSKAHCLNCIMKHIDSSAWRPHFVAIHDAEDVIHPDAFTAINAESDRLDFIQIPIFSLPVPSSDWVSGTYLDEFAEIHLKEIPVRQHLGMPIPSAGVGTFFSYSILKKMEASFGYVFDEGNLTEDYEISLRIARARGVQKFLLIRDEKGEMIATREYFPHEFMRSIRQKTRWTTGIALQTTQKWKGYGCLKDGLFKRRNLALTYGLFRDRKSLWSNPSVLLAWAMIPMGLIHRPDVKQIALLFHLNLALFGLRLLQRARFCTVLYGWKHGALSLPRVFLSNVINSWACIRAMVQFYQTPTNQNRRDIVWDKTEHRFPDLDAA